MKKMNRKDFKLLRDDISKSFFDGYLHVSDLEKALERRGIEVEVEPVIPYLPEGLWLAKPCDPDDNYSLNWKVVTNDGKATVIEKCSMTTAILAANAPEIVEAAVAFLRRLFPDGNPYIGEEKSRIFDRLCLAIQACGVEKVWIE